MAPRTSPDRTGDLADDLSDTLADGTSRAASAVGSGLSRGYRGTVDALDEFGDRLSETGHSIADASMSASANVWEEATRATRRSRAFLQREPVALAALTLAAGAGLAYALPRTRTEAEWLGETRDRLLDEAKDRSLRGLETARAEGGDLLADVVRDARARGLSPEVISAAVQELGAKLEKVADAAAKEAASKVPDEGGKG